MMRLAGGAAGVLWLPSAVMRKEISNSGWRAAILNLVALVAALALAVTVQACGGSSGKNANGPKAANAEEQATQALAQAIEAEGAGQADVADEQYRRARELRPQHLETAERHTRFLIAQRRGDDAVAEAKQFLDQSLNELRGYYLLAEAQVAAGDYTGAHDTLSQLIELEATDAAAFAKRGEVAIKQKNFEAGLGDLRRAVDMSPDKPEFRVMLGKALQEAGDLDGAAKELAAVVEAHPDHLAAHLAYGAVLRAQGELDEAFALHQKAVELAGDDPMTHYELGISQYYLGKGKDAEASLKRAAELGPDDAQVRYVYGEVLRNLERYDESAQRYREALERDPDHDKAATKLAMVLTYLDKMDEADTVLQARIARHPEDSEAYYLLGTVYEKQEKYTEAVKAYDKFLELAPNGDPNGDEARKRVRLLKRKLK
jgi:protein O-GlcNAc transferase